MNNFLRGFGNFKKNENGITEYVDYLGVKYTLDPTTKKWKSNGRILSEAAISDIILSEQEGVGDAADDSGGGARRSAQIQDTFDLQFAFEPNGSALISPFTDIVIYKGGPSGGYAPPLYDYRNNNKRFLIDHFYFVRKPTDHSYHFQKYSEAASNDIHPYIFPTASDLITSPQGTTYLVSNGGFGNIIDDGAVIQWLQTTGLSAFGYTPGPGSTLTVMIDFENWFDPAFLYGASGGGGPYSTASKDDTILDINPSYAGTTLFRIVQGPNNTHAINEVNECITSIKNYFGNSLTTSIHSFPRMNWIHMSNVTTPNTFVLSEGWTSDNNYFPYASTQGNTHFSNYFKLSDYAVANIPAGLQAAELPKVRDAIRNQAYYQFLRAHTETDYMCPFNFRAFPTVETIAFYAAGGITITFEDLYADVTEEMFREFTRDTMYLASSIAGTTYAKDTINDLDQDRMPFLSIWYMPDAAIFKEVDASTTLDNWPLFIPADEQEYNAYSMRQYGANAMQWYGASSFLYDNNPTNVRRDILYNVFGLTFNESNQTYWFPTIAGLCGIPDLATSSWTGFTGRNFFSEVWNNYLYGILTNTKTILTDIFPIREPEAITPTNIYFELAGKTLAAQTTFLGVTCHVRFVNQNEYYENKQNYTPIIDYAFNPGLITIGATSQIGSIPVDSSIAYRIDSWVEGTPNHMNPSIDAIHGLTFNVVNASANESVIGTFHLSLDYEDHG